VQKIVSGFHLVCGNAGLPTIGNDGVQEVIPPYACDEAFFLFHDLVMAVGLIKSKLLECG
jgi:uncharacterized membrane protein YukC